MCLLAAIALCDVTTGFAQSTQQPESQAAPASAPAKPAKLDTKVEREDRSEREKREELGKKLERRRTELNSVPQNSLMPSNGRSVKAEDADRSNSTDNKTKVKK
jgi:hypothetical protein